MGCGSSTSTGAPSRTTDTDRTLSPAGRGRGRGRDSPDSRGHGGHGKEDFVEEALRSHNEYRYKFWSRALSTFNHKRIFVPRSFIVYSDEKV